LFAAMLPRALQYLHQKQEPGLAVKESDSIQATFRCNNDDNEDNSDDSNNNSNTLQASQQQQQ
jgi:hypothetical protein